MLERLQKILSARGIASRRKAEEYIARGLVTVNGKVAVIGQKADPGRDLIEVAGTVLEERQDMLYYLMNKPVGAVTSNVAPREGKQGKEGKQGDQGNGSSAVTVRDLLPPRLRGKIFPVGRLDKDSSGLLLFTNDGALAYRLTHPKFDHEKEYEVALEQPIFDGALRKLASGLTIFGEKTKPARVRRLAPDRFRIVLTEGRNRQIRRMVQKVGSRVKTLARVRIVTVEDRSLAPGRLRLLTSEEIALLKRKTMVGCVQSHDETNDAIMGRNGHHPSWGGKGGHRDLP